MRPYMTKEQATIFANTIADYILENDATIIDTAAYFNSSRCVVAYHIHRTLRDINPNKFELVRQAFTKHRQKKKASTWERPSAKLKKGYYFVRDENDRVEICEYNGEEFDTNKHVLWVLSAEKQMKKWGIL